jgi:hypothetical protein
MWRTCQATLLSAVNANRDVRFRAVVIVNVMTPCHGSKVREKQPEVVVIGAGIAGLTAAALLAKNGARVRRWCDVGQWLWAARCSPAARRAVGIERRAAARIRPRGRAVLARAGADPAGAFMVYALVRDARPSTRAGCASRLIPSSPEPGSAPTSPIAQRRTLSACRRPPRMRICARSRIAAGSLGSLRRQRCSGSKHGRSVTVGRSRRQRRELASVIVSQTYAPRLKHKPTAAISSRRCARTFAARGLSALAAKRHVFVAAEPCYAEKC